MMAQSFKKEAEEEPLKDLQQDVKEKEQSFNFCLNSQKQPFSVTCKTSMTVLEALNTREIFKFEKEKKKQKEILILRSIGEHHEAAVKTDFPCCLIEKDEILDITFIKKDENSSTNQQTTADPSLLSKRSQPETLVIFLVEKGGGEGVTCLLKSEALRKNVRYVCVFAFIGEKIKTALKRDGRFKDAIFKKHCALSGPKINHELSMPVTKTLNEKAFQVVVISDNNLSDSQDDEIHVKTEPNVASDADAAENAGPSQNPINPEQEKKNGNTTKSTNPSTKRYAAKTIDKSDEILGILRDQFKDLLETLKKREKQENTSLVQTFFRTEYGKSVENFLEVKKVKKLMKLSDSVCQIRDGESAIGTGFLLFDRFILTNAHVIGIKDDHIPVKVEQFTAVFDYEEQKSQTNCIPVKQLIAFFKKKDGRGRYLDYALLELGAFNVNEKYTELVSCYSPNLPINRTQICIVGHPDKDVKKMDPCFIIKRKNRLEAGEKHKSENQHLIEVMTQKCFEEQWDFSAYENQITYDSCFFYGSSGSPVFDVDCKLIAIHTGGYVYKEEGPKTWSVMEYGFTMQPILDNIKAQAKDKGFNEIVKIIELHSNKSNESGAAEQENQNDVEMKDAEELE